MLCQRANIIKAKHVAAAYLNKLDYKIFFLIALRTILNFLFDWRYICVTYLLEDYFIIYKRHSDCVDCIINTSIILCISRWTPVSLLYFHANNEESKNKLYMYILFHFFVLSCYFLTWRPLNNMSHVWLRFDRKISYLCVSANELVLFFILKLFFVCS